MGLVLVAYSAGRGEWPTGLSHSRTRKLGELYTNEAKGAYGKEAGGVTKEVEDGI